MRVRLLPVLALALAAVFASPLSAYIIYLKGGSQLEAREKPTVQGKFLVFYTPLGAMQRVPVSEYDEKKTIERNALGTGNAYVLGDAPQDKPIEAAQRPSLSQYIQIHKKSEIGEEPKAAPVAPGGRATKILDPAAAGGPTLDPQVEGLFLRTLESFGVKAPRVVAAGAGVRVQGVTESEDQVFSALKGIARAITESRTSPHPVPKADIYLTTSTGENAGHYEMSSEDADALASGRKSAAAWFMSNVAL